MSGFIFVKKGKYKKKTARFGGFGMNFLLYIV